MKNRTITLITALFSIMLLGIILIQAWWIRRSLQLNEQAFNAAVYRSMEGVVKQTEELENFSFIKNKIDHETFVKNIHTIIPIYHHKISEHIEVNVNTTTGQKQTIVKIEKDRNEKKTSHKRIVIASAGAIPQTTPIPPVPPVSGIAALPEVPEAPEFTDSELFVIDDKKENVAVIIEKMQQIKNPDSVSIKPAELKKIISTQLAQNNLFTSVDFALYKKDGTVFYADKGFSDSAGAYKINLYPRDLYGRNLNLALLIPGKSNYINSNVWWVFALSLMFTLSILFLFVYSIRMLVKHKNLLEIKNDFINHMSHELKTPLATISLGADMLIGKTDKMNEVQIQKIASSIKKQSVRLHEDMKQILLNALLDNYHAKEEIFNLVEICKQTLNEMQFLLDDKRAAIETHFEPEQLFIKGDADLWHKVFSNLLDNALKFSKEIPEIHISITQTHDAIHIEIADRGIGIAEKDLAQIFDKFYRADYYKRSNIQGFGLGLSFVKKIVELHKGIIKVESKLDIGTTFIIVLAHE
jgi:two-component system phosphate regulon sensor histidine kinase PhoR